MSLPRLMLSGVEVCKWVRAHLTMHFLTRRDIFTSTMFRRYCIDGLAQCGKTAVLFTLGWFRQ